ncbi:MAG TPA: HNH endonuclease signature motif containing protein [Streptosporangiaceae bacterium]
MPLTTLLHLSDSPGDAAGYGPLDPDTTRALACAAAGHRATRWHLTITGPDDQAIGHGRTTAAETTPVRQGDASSGWTATVTAEPIATGQCEHRTREPGYRPSPALQRLIRARNTTCTAPGCRRPAVRCDLDHTVPHGQDGLTCECNLAALCRHHHRVKQAEGWTLQQTAPGTLTWTTPARRRYTTYPSKHPT